MRFKNLPQLTCGPQPGQPMKLINDLKNFTSDAAAAEPAQRLLQPAPLRAGGVGPVGRAARAAAARAARAGRALPQPGPLQAWTRARQRTTNVKQNHPKSIRRIKTWELAKEHLCKFRMLFC